MQRWMLYEADSVSHVRSVRDLIEPRVRYVVAEHLAVDSRVLADGVSIRDDLAADSLDLVELSLILEREFGMELTDRVVDGMRSYGDLVDGLVRLIVLRARTDRSGKNACGPQVRAQLRSSRADTRHWAGILTMYMVETLVAATKHAGADACLEIIVGAETSRATLDRVRSHFVGVGVRAIAVSVMRSATAGPLSTRPPEMAR